MKDLNQKKNRRINAVNPELYTIKTVSPSLCVFMCAFKRNEMWRIHFNLNDVWMMKWTIRFGIWIHLSQHWTVPYGVEPIFYRYTFLSIFPSLAHSLCMSLVSVEFTSTPGKKHPSAICLITNGERRTGKKWISFRFGYFLLLANGIYQRNG